LDFGGREYWADFLNENLTLIYLTKLKGFGKFSKRVFASNLVTEDI